MNTGSNPTANVPRRILALIAVAIGLSSSGCGPSEKQLREEAERKAKEVETAQIEALKSKVLDRLTDPASAQFRKVKLLQGNKGLCGEINAKNKLGGYVGFSAFAVDSTGNAIILKTMTLDVAKDSPENITKLAVSMTLAGNKSDGESLIYDSVQSKQFAHWSECGN